METVQEIKQIKRKEKKMKSNGFIKSNDKVKFIQKAILAGVGAAISKDTIKKAATHLYNDVQKEVQKLLVSLENEGELKAKETKKLILELQRKSEAEKLKIYKELRKNTKPFLQAAQNVLMTPLKLIQEKIKPVRTIKASKTKKRTSAKKSRKRK